MREMRLQLRKEKRDAIKQMYINQMGDPDLDAVLKEDAKVYDLPEQVVTVTPLDPNEIAGNLNLSMGYNKKSAKHAPSTSPKKQTKS